MDIPHLYTQMIFPLNLHFKRTSKLTIFDCAGQYKSGGVLANSFQLLICVVWFLEIFRGIVEWWFGVPFSHVI